MTTTRRTGTPSLFRRVACSLLLAGGTAALWGVGVERHLFTLRTDTLPVLPRGSRPLRVLHLSDFHLTPGQRQKVKWIRGLARKRPDLIVLTGDLMGHADALPMLYRALEPFHGTPGVFVHGSNDYYGPIFKNPLKYLRKPRRLATRIPDLDTAALERMLTDTLGFVNLNNTARDVTVGEQTVRVFGLGDPHIRYDEPGLMREALHPLDREAARPITRLGLVHAPYREVLDELLQHHPAVIFSGHTHGGQVRIPGLGALTSNSDLPASQARGTSVWHDQDDAAFLHVSAGLGHSLYAPVRFACRPEASLITLTE